MLMQSALDLIERHRRESCSDRALLVALSGIDGSGKGYLAKKLSDALRVRGFHAIAINIDGWLNLPHVRFSANNPPEHFYRHAIRFEEMFSELVDPLCARRSIDVEADFVEETAKTFRRHRYRYHDVDIVLLEGIYLFKRELAARYAVKLWVECSFETALERAIARAQEGLSAEQTIAAYHSIYLPAQRIHFERDRPREVADQILINDPRLENAV
jgi:uridine kinase